MRDNTHYHEWAVAVWRLRTAQAALLYSRRCAAGHYPEAWRGAPATDWRPILRWHEQLVGRALDRLWNAQCALQEVEHGG